MVIQSTFNKLGWGFLFIMIDFRITGFDILPDVVGYILFAIALNRLIEHSVMFKKAFHLNTFMIIISMFSIYQRTPEDGGGQWNLFGLLIGILSLIFGLMVAFLLFRGIQQMADDHGAKDLHDEAGRRWSQYLALQFAAIVAFLVLIIPPVAVAYMIALFILSFIFTFHVYGLMRRCGDRFNPS